MNIKNYDFNTPLVENRDEVILIKVMGGLKNASEILFNTMCLDNLNEWANKYPRIWEVLSLKDFKKIYDYTAHFTPARFIDEMRQPRERLEDEEFFLDMTKLFSKADPTACSITSLELGMRKMCSYDFLKKIYIHNWMMTDNMVDYVKKLFVGYEYKVEIIGEKNMKEAVEEYPDITTIFSDDADEVMELLEYYEGINEPLKLTDKQFFVMADPSWIHDGTTDDSNTDLALKYFDYFKESPQRFHCMVTWINNHYIDLNDRNPGLKE